MVTLLYLINGNTLKLLVKNHGISVVPVTLVVKLVVMKLVIQLSANVSPVLKPHQLNGFTQQIYYARTKPFVLLVNNGKSLTTHVPTVTLVAKTVKLLVLMDVLNVTIHTPTSLVVKSVVITPVLLAQHI